MKWNVKVKSISPVRLFATPWTAAYQALSSVGFSRQEYWSGVPSSSLHKDLVVFNKAEVDFFLELSCFFYDPTDIGNLISGSSAFSKFSLNIWKFMVHILLKPGLENFEHYFVSVWDVCNCAVVWELFDIAFLSDRNENWPFPVLWPLLNFPDLLAHWVQHFHSIIFRIWSSSTGIPSPLHHGVFLAVPEEAGWLECLITLLVCPVKSCTHFLKKNLWAMLYCQFNHSWLTESLA